MERCCFQLQVKPDRIDEYREVHRAVWPEMLEALRATGWRNYSLFLRDDGLLIGYFEAEDVRATLAAMAATEVNDRWQSAHAALFEQTARADQSLVVLDEVFHLSP